MAKRFNGSVITVLRPLALRRLAEIDEERAGIIAAFPDLRPAKPAQAAPAAPVRRRKMSKEARRRIGEAQRARWALKKAQTKGSKTGSRA